MRTAQSLLRMTVSGPPLSPTILTTQTALLHHTNKLSHKSLTLTHDNGYINAVETLNPDAAPHTLFLLHGWGAGLAMFYRALPRLPFATVYSIDLPGMGGSSRERFPDSYAPAVDYFLTALEQAFEQLSRRESCVGKRLLAGHSLGGYIAAEWQLRQPRFDGLFLVSPVGVPQKPDTNPRLGLLWRVVRSMWGSGITPQAVIRRLGRRPVKSFVKARFDLPEVEEQLLSDYLYHISVAPAAAEKSINVLLQPGAWARVPLKGRLAGIDAPVAFLYGEKDWMDWKAAEEVREELRWSCVKRVKGAGHHVFIDNPGEFAEVVGNVFEDMSKDS